MFLKSLYASAVLFVAHTALLFQFAFADAPYVI